MMIGLVAVVALAMVIVVVMMSLSPSKLSVTYAFPQSNSCIDARVEQTINGGYDEDDDDSDNESDKVCDDYDDNDSDKYASFYLLTLLFQASQQLQLMKTLDPYSSKLLFAQNQ